MLRRRFIFIFLLFSILVIRSEELEPLDKIFVTENEANFYFLNRTCVRLEDCADGSLFFDSINASVQRAKDLVFNHPDICNEAKLRVKNLEIWYQKDLCATAVGVCCSESGLFSLGIQLSCKWESFFDLWQNKIAFEKVLVFGLLQAFAHIIYRDFHYDMVCWSKDEKDVYLSDFAYKNARAVYFALDLTKDERVAKFFFKIENLIRLPYEPRLKINGIREVDRSTPLDKILNTKNDVRMKDVSSFDLTKKRHWKVYVKNKLIQHYEKTKKLVVKFGHVVASNCLKLTPFFEKVKFKADEQSVDIFSLREHVTREMYFLIKSEKRTHFFYDRDMKPLSEADALSEKVIFLREAIEWAQGVVANHPDVSKNGKTLVARVKFFINPRSCKAAVGCCSFANQKDEMGIYFSEAFFKIIDPLNQQMKSFIFFSLLRQFAHIVYKDFSIGAESSIFNLQSMEPELFCYKTKRSFYFASELTYDTEISDAFCKISDQLDAFINLQLNYDNKKISKDFFYFSKQKYSTGIDIFVNFLANLSKARKDLIDGYNNCWAKEKLDVRSGEVSTVPHSIGFMFY